MQNSVSLTGKGAFLYNVSSFYTVLYYRFFIRRAFPQPMIEGRSYAPKDCKQALASFPII